MARKAFASKPAPLYALSAALRSACPADERWHALSAQCLEDRCRTSSSNTNEPSQDQRFSVPQRLHCTGLPCGLKSRFGKVFSNRTVSLRRHGGNWRTVESRENQYGGRRQLQRLVRARYLTRQVIPPQPSLATIGSRIHLEETPNAKFSCGGRWRTVESPPKKPVWRPASTATAVFGQTDAFMRPILTHACHLPSNRSHRSSVSETQSSVATAAGGTVELRKMMCSGPAGGQLQRLVRL